MHDIHLAPCQAHQWPALTLSSPHIFMVVLHHSRAVYQVVTAQAASQVNQVMQHSTHPSMLNCSFFNVLL